MKFAENKHELSPGAIHCRGLGHSWEPLTAPYVQESTFKGYNVTLGCKSCGTLKHFMLSVRGEYFPATYTYSDGYLLKKGNPWITREDKGEFKLEALGLPTVSQSQPVGATVTPIKSKSRKRA